MCNHRYIHWLSTASERGCRRSVRLPGRGKLSIRKEQKEDLSVVLSRGY